MGYNHTIGVGMLLPILSQYFTDGNNKKITNASLSGYTLTFSMYPAPGQAATVNAQAAAIALDADGVTADFNYTWQTGDTASPGSYVGKFIATSAAGKKEEFPSGSWLNILVEPVS